MRMLDLQVQRGLDQINKAVKEFFEQAPSLSKEEQNRRYAKLKEEYRRIREQAEEKVSIAEAMYTLMEKYSQKLNKEILHFKYELEADNPGITEQIEKKFSEAERALIMQRKERKKRLHESSQCSSPVVNGNGSTIKLERPSTPVPSRSSVPRSNANGSNGDSVHFDSNPSAHNSRSSFTQHDDESMSGMSSGRGARISVGADRDPDLPPLKVTVKRSATNPNKLVAVSNIALSPSMSSLSPACSEKGSDRWTGSNLSSPAVPSANSSSRPTHHQNHVVGVGTSNISTVSMSSATTSSGPSMLTFAGQESRHGRPRKLTSRVQEMLKDTMQRHERRVPSHHSPEHEASDDDDSDHDNDKRTWCICNEKSYGCMVACDNKSCPYEWFHYECVNLTQPPKGKWYCPHCIETKQRRSVSLEGT